MLYKYLFITKNVIIFAPSNNKTISNMAQTMTNRKSNKSAGYGFMDDEMRELMEAMCSVIVPRSERKAVVRTNYHAPYYSKSRYSYL